MRPTIQQLKTILRYNPDTGELLRAPHWKPVALTAKSSRDAVIEIFCRRYAARRVVWAIMTGEWPDERPHTVRVQNGNPFDLRWSNLYIIPAGHHQCSRCRAVLPDTEFGSSAGKKPRIAGYCRACVETARKEVDYAHHTKVRRYGLTVADYDALLTEQNGACAICHRPPIGKRLAVDHCHTTGKVRGLLCSPCNVSLGQFDDDPRRLLEAAKYLLRAKNCRPPNPTLKPT
jgi:hypothetical protein